MCRLSLLRVVLASTVSSLLFLSSCASSGTKPDDMSANEHQAQADADRAAAKEHDKDFKPEAVGIETSGQNAAVTNQMSLFWTEAEYNPTLGHKIEADRLNGLAAQHQAAADTLRKFEVEECKSFPETTRISCPLIGPISKVEDVEGGARFFVREGVPVDAMVAHIKCHFAAARTNGYDGMEGCPLYLKGVRVESGEGYIDILNDDASLVEDLRSRARAHAGASDT